MDDKMRKRIAEEIEKLNIVMKARKKSKEGKSKPSPKKSGFVNKRTRISQATGNTYNSNSDTDQPHWSKASISEEEDIGIHNSRGISRVGIINEEVKGWTSSSKQQEAPPEPKNTKEEIRLEKLKESYKIISQLG